MNRTPRARYVRVLSIAGSDSGGGAGIQADLKTFAALGCFGMTAVTAVTVQNTLGVSGIHGIPPQTVAAQIDAVVGDIGVDAVKIGMLHSQEIVQAVADAIDRHRLRCVVLDPVMVATSGDRLLDENAQSALCRELFPRAALITPNLDEASLLLARKVGDEHALEAAARDLLALGAPAVLLKGGHLPDDRISDVLVAVGQQPLRLNAQRIVTANGHGTGCTLSAAIAAYLAQGMALAEAAAQAHAWILGAIAAGKDVKTGHGSGPLNHGYAPIAQKVLRNGDG